MKKILIIGCYFGRLRSDFENWVKACENNPTIDWLLFTDSNIENLSSNIKNIKIEFKDLVYKVKSKFDFDICIDKSYKLCDYKPAYGYIFNEYLKDYDFWGYCDFDMIFGNIRSFITEEILENYDKIYHLGHLSLYKNNHKINTAFMSDKGIMKYKDVFKTKNIKVFDEEYGINVIFNNEKLKIYKKLDFVDISRFTRRILHSELTEYYDFKIPRDYKYQVFFYDKGNLYKIYKKSKKANIEKEEIVYIHFSNKKMDYINSDRYLITSLGLINYDKDVDDRIFNYDINKYLRVEKVFMKLREFNFRLKRKLNKIKVSMEERKNQYGRIS